MENKSLDTIQKEAREWTERNFPNQPWIHPLIGMIEEVGELADCVLVSLSKEEYVTYAQVLHIASELGQLAHRVLKEEQKIRNGEKPVTHHFERFHEMKNIPPEQLRELERDALGDIDIFKLNFCSARGHSASDILNETWEEVKKRDWVRFPKDGLTE